MSATTAPTTPNPTGESAWATVGIRTRYLGPTNYRVSRIVADVPERLRTIDRDRSDVDVHQRGHWRLVADYPDELRSGAPAHEPAARALAERLGWANPGDVATVAALADCYVWTFAAPMLTEAERVAILDAVEGFDPARCTADHEHDTGDCFGWSPQDVDDLASATQKLDRVTR